MKIRIALGVVVVAVSLAALSGCSSASTDSATRTDTGSVQFVATDDPAAYTDVISAFEKLHPGITIDYSQIPFDQYSSTIQQRIGAKDDTIDVYAVDQPRMAQLAAQGFLEDLSALKDKTKAAVTESSYDVSVYQDKLWALPISNSTQLLYYNKKALDAAGIAYPSVDPAQRLTWEQIAADGAATQASGTKYGLLFEQPDAYYQVQPLAESLGGGSGFTGDDNLGVDVTNDGWVNALSWYSDDYASGLSARGIGTFQTNPVFANGDAAYFVGGPWDVATFAATAIDWGVAPMPYFADGTANTPTGSWSWGLNPASHNKSTAQAFMEYAALDTGGSLATSGTSANIPANKAAEEQYLPQLNGLAGEHSAGVGDLIAYETSQTATPRPVSVGFPQFEDAINKAIADIRSGSPVANRLGQAQQEITEAWAQLR